jgi:hypothetical protein
MASKSSVQLDSDSRGARLELEIKGTEIGTDLGSVPWGWFRVATGIGVFATSFGRAKPLLLAALAALAVAGLNAATVSNGKVHATAGINGQQVDALLRPRVSIAWGSLLELGAALVALISGAVLAKTLEGRPPEGLRRARDPAKVKATRT